MARVLTYGRRSTSQLAIIMVVINSVLNLSQCTYYLQQVHNPYQVKNVADNVAAPADLHVRRMTWTSIPIPHNCFPCTWACTQTSSRSFCTFKSELFYPLVTFY
ncbi:hypothetical protein ABKN59_006520 [Abortiporus biennis]